MMYCPNCGKPNEDDTVFCEHCGKSLLEDADEGDFDEKAEREEPNGARKARSKKAALIAVAVVAAIAVISIVAVFALGSNGGGDEKQEPIGSDSAQSTASGEHVIVFETSGGTAYGPATVKTDDMVASPEDPTKDGAAFEGWYSDEALTEQVDFPYAVKEDDPDTIVFYAKWRSDDSLKSGASQAAAVSPPHFVNCTASSQLPGDQKTPDYGPGMARDGYPMTAWNEGAPGDGTGEWIQLESPQKQHVSGLKIKTGFQKSPEINSQNRRPKDITISFEDGTSYNVVLDDIYGQYQVITFKKPIDTRIVRITINSTYEGKYFDDCCISEIEEF